MKRLLVALAALAAVVPSPAAYAGGSSTHTGECFLADHDHDLVVVTSSDEVLLGAVVAVHDAADPATPAAAAVTCQLRVGGTPMGSAYGSGTGAVLVLGPAWYGPDDTAPFELCTIVDYADATPTATECAVVPTIRIPPDGGHVYVVDTVNALVVEHVNPVACAAFGDLAPGVEPFGVTEQGDVYVGGELWWDCPPYEAWPAR